MCARVAWARSARCGARYCLATAPSFDAINTGELSVLDDLVTEDFVDHGSPFPLPPGPAGYRQILTFVHHVLAIRYAIDDIFDTGDRVVIRATATGIGVDAVHGPGTEGKPYQMTTVHIYRTEGSAPSPTPPPSPTPRGSQVMVRIRARTAMRASSM
ncbi:ester cyclase [Amycolatopsis sp. GM8]|uniref:ester cyclase n=1 Tax=Amycolatopsis sp. GM8 TaxID=2896530 RepID=UPI001F179BB4|nr:ester cyclase [Amycolatopsis sp. GM8]